MNQGYIEGKHNLPVAKPMINRNRRQAANKLAEVHRANLQKRLEHRLAVAKAKGDENLIRALESEMEKL
jgi:hypothetical protein